MTWLLLFFPLFLVFIYQQYSRLPLCNCSSWSFVCCEWINSTMHIKLLCILDERNYVECGNTGFLLWEVIIVPCSISIHSFAVYPSYFNQCKQCFMCTSEQSWWIIENYFPDKCDTNVRNVRNMWLRLTLCWEGKIICVRLFWYSLVHFDWCAAHWCVFIH
jgi:hypothetical protein